MKKTYAIFLAAFLFTTGIFAQSVKLWEKGPVDYSWFGTGHTTRGMAYNSATGHVLVAARSASEVFILDGATGDSLGMLDMTGVSGGTFPMNIVKATSDGVIYLCNLTVSGTGFTIYRWSNESATPTVAFTGNVTGRTGDAMGISGTGTNTVIYASGSSSTAINVFTTADGSTFTNSKTITIATGIARGGISPVTTGTSSDLWVNGAGTLTELIDSNGNMVDTVSGAAVYGGWSNVAYLKTTSGEEYIGVVARNDPYGTHTWLLDVTSSKVYPPLVANMNLSVTYTANTNGTGDMALKENADGSITVYTMITNNGVAAFKVFTPMTIAKAREDLNNDLIPDNLNDTVFVKGVVISPNYQTSNRSYYISDGTAGIDLFSYGMGSPALKLGDSVTVLGKIAQYHGLTEIISLTDSSVVVIDSNATVPQPMVLTVHEFLTNAEKYEGSLLKFNNLTKVSGTWPTSGSSDLKMTDGTDTLDLYIDSDTDIKNHPEPTWPQDVIAVGSQYSSSSSTLNDGYQALPRYYTDFQPATVVPVELTSFQANINNGTVELTWSTATETNNSGFEVERGINGKIFSSIGFVKGQGNSVNISNYSFTDKPDNSATYYYRLKQIDYSGSYSYSKVIEISVKTPHVFTLEQNYPNPFNPSTLISFDLPVNAKVSLKVYNVIGQKVATLLNSNLSAGKHEITFNASNINSGVYFYQIRATGVNGQVYTTAKKMILTK